MTQADFFTPLSGFKGVDGKVCCLSGNFEYGTKSSISKMIFGLGGEVTESMSRNVNVLVVGAKGNEAWNRGIYGSKVEKALDYNRQGLSIVIISEKDFLDNLHNEGGNAQTECPEDKAQATEPEEEKISSFDDGDFLGFDELTKAKITRDFIYEISCGNMEALKNDEADNYFEYVLNLIEYEIKDRTPKPIKIKKAPFSITPERAMEFEYSDKPIGLSEIAMRLWELRESENMYTFTYTPISKWLVSVGMLEEHYNKTGNIFRRPTELGKEIGIITESHNGINGNHVNVYYNREAQEFIVNNIQDILDFNRQ